MSSLQGRKKWTDAKPNVKIGDVVLLKDSQVQRNEWPLGLIVNTIPSKDSKVRKVEIKVNKQGTVKTFLVLLSQTT